MNLPADPEPVAPSSKRDAPAGPFDPWEVDSLAFRLVDGLPDMVLILDRDHRVCQVNAGFLRRTGQSRDHILGQRCSEVADGCSSQDACPAQQVWQTGTTVRLRRASVGEDGQTRTREITACPLPDERGRVEYVIEIHRDVTAERQLEDTLTAIYHLGQELALTRDELEIARSIVRAARQVLRFPICCVSFPRNDELVVVASEGYGRPVDIRMPLNGDLGITVAAYHTGQPINQPDARSDPRYVAGGEFRSRSELAVPIKTGDLVIGVLNVESEQPAAFSEADQRLFTTLADVAAVALQSAHAYQAEQQRAAEMTALYQLGVALVNQGDPAAIAEQIFAGLGGFLQADTAVLNTLDPETGLLVGFGYDRGQPMTVPALPLDGPSLSAFVVRTGEALHIDDLHATPGPVAGVLEGELPHSWLGVPLRVADRITGCLTAQAYRPGAFGPAEERLLTLIAAQVAPVLENARLYRVQHRRAEEMTALSRITRQLASGLTFQQLFAGLAGDLQRIAPCDRVSVSLLEDPAHPRTIHLYAVYDGANLGAEPVQTLSVTNGAAAADILARRPHLTDDLSTESEFLSSRSLYARGLRSRINLPLVVRGRVIGSLNLFSREPAAYRPERTPLLQQVADAVAAAVDNSQLYQKVRSYAAELEAQVRLRTAELRTERDRTRAILDSAAEGVIVTSVDGTIEYVNPAVERLTGYAAAELVGRRPSLWKSGQHPDYVYRRMWELIRSGQVWEGELVNRRKDGSLYDAMLTIAPILGPDGQPTGFVGIQADISELKGVERLKDRFVSNVSHELRTPLTNLKLYLNLLEIGRPEKRPQYLATLNREANRLQQLIEDLLSLSRLDVGTAQIRRVPTQLNDLLLQLVQDRTEAAAQQGRTLAIYLDPALPPVPIDQELITQVMSNLLSNAISYTPAGGSIDVRSSLTELAGRHWAAVSVTDTGYGIAAEEQEHLFERFFRGEAAQESGAPGTGLGLAICQEIVARHKGRITVESELRQGSTFTVWLPIDHTADGDGPLSQIGDDAPA